MGEYILGKLRKVLTWKRKYRKCCLVEVC